jgi:hypothetical protein
MKPASFANYLDHLGQDRRDRPAPVRENSPFRPRSLNSPQGAEQRRASPFIALRANGAAEAQINNPTRPSPWNGRRPAALANPVESLVAHESVKAEEMAARLADAYARGREEGRAEAEARLEELRAADRAAAQDAVEAERIEFQINQYAELDAAIRAGFSEIGETVGAAVARILAPFLAEEVVKRATDELCKKIARLGAGRSAGLITIRGPERLLTRLRERIADLPAAIEYVEDEGVEAVVETNSTQIMTELRPWADLLASVDR